MVSSGSYKNILTINTKTIINKGRLLLIKGERNGSYKGGYDNNIPLYDTYQPQLQPYGVECRRSPNDENILEVKCMYCNQWFTPTRSHIYNKIQTLEGNVNYDYRLDSYCSDKCKLNNILLKSSKYYKSELNKYNINTVIKNNELYGYCSKCNNLFILSKISITNKLSAIKGYVNGIHDFYCSDECKLSCNLYGKSYHTLQKRIDIINGKWDNDLYKLYRSEVQKVTYHQYKHNQEIVNPNNYKKGNNEYHIDHLYSVYKGFKNNIPPYIIGSYHNIRLVTREENLSKGCKCSITKEELHNRYFNGIKTNIPV